MALISEWMEQCGKKVLDNAGIVRDAIFQQLQAISLIENLPEPGQSALSGCYASCGSLRLLARFDQIVQINFHPQAWTLVKWMKRVYLPRFLIPIPSFIWCHGVRFHHGYLFGPTARDCYRKFAQQFLAVVR